ncbi:hypothetical protein STEG23_011056 [Scotinomys teguina]
MDSNVIKFDNTNDIPDFHAAHDSIHFENEPVGDIHHCRFDPNATRCNKQCEFLSLILPQDMDKEVMVGMTWSQVHRFDTYNTSRVKKEQTKAVNLVLQGHSWSDSSITDFLPDIDDASDNHHFDIEMGVRTGAGCGHTNDSNVIKFDNTNDIPDFHAAHDSIHFENETVGDIHHCRFDPNDVDDASDNHHFDIEMGVRTGAGCGHTNDSNVIKFDNTNDIPDFPAAHDTIHFENETVADIHHCRFDPNGPRFIEFDHIQHVSDIDDASDNHHFDIEMGVRTGAGCGHTNDSNVIKFDNTNDIPDFPAAHDTIHFENETVADIHHCRFDPNENQIVICDAFKLLDVTTQELFFLILSSRHDKGNVGNDLVPGSSNLTNKATRSFDVDDASDNHHFDIEMGVHTGACCGHTNDSNVIKFDNTNDIPDFHAAHDSIHFENETVGDIHHCRFDPNGPRFIEFDHTQHVSDVDDASDNHHFDIEMGVRTGAGCGHTNESDEAPDNNDLDSEKGAGTRRCHFDPSGPRFIEFDHTQHVSDVDDASDNHHFDIEMGVHTGACCGHTNGR